jgi:hypothetical protein
MHRSNPPRIFEDSSAVRPSAARLSTLEFRVKRLFISYIRLNRPTPHPPGVINQAIACKAAIILRRALRNRAHRTLKLYTTL